MMLLNIDQYHDGRYYLNREWERNRDSMMLYLQQVHRGVKGQVTTQLLTNDTPQGVAQAVVTVRDEAGTVVGKHVTSSDRGEYWKLLLPGQYTVTRILIMWR